MLELGLFLGFVFFCYVSLKILVSRFKKKQKLSEIFGKISLDYAFVRPAECLLAAMALSYSAIWALREIGVQEDDLGAIFLTRDLAFIFCAAWALFRWKKAFYRSLLVRRGEGKVAFDPTSLSFLSKLFTVCVAGLVGLSSLHILGVNILPLITFGGIGAASIAFASKDVFANFFSGLMLHMTGPFAVGDQVELPNRKLVGHIEEIGWCLTVVRDLQKKPMYLPNSVFSSEVVINHSRMTHRRIEEALRFRLEEIDSVSSVVEGIRAYLSSHLEIDHSQPVYVFLKNLTSLFAEIEIKAYTLDTSYASFMNTKQEILLHANEIGAQNSLGR